MRRKGGKRKRDGRWPERREGKVETRDDGGEGERESGKGGRVRGIKWISKEGKEKRKSIDGCLRFEKAQL